MGGAGLLARIVAIGLLLGAIGAIGGIGTVRALSSLLYGVQPADRATFGMVAALLGAIGIIACVGPGLRRHASRRRRPLRVD